MFKHWNLQCLYHKLVFTVEKMGMGQKQIKEGREGGGKGRGEGGEGGGGRNLVIKLGGYRM